MKMFVFLGISLFFKRTLLQRIIIFSLAVHSMRGRKDKVGIFAGHERKVYRTKLNFDFRPEYHLLTYVEKLGCKSFLFKGDFMFNVHISCFDYVPPKKIWTTAAT